MLILIIAVGSIYAAEDSQSKIIDGSVDDFDDDGSDYDDWDDDLDDDGSDYDDWDDDLDDDGSDYDDWDDDLDDDGSDYDDFDYDNLDDYNDTDLEINISDYEYMEFKILRYLEKYGNCTIENWTSSEKFHNEYNIYLENPSNYTLNQSAEGYETYLKIYDSITSTFKDYNLTENETTYFKFIVIFYLNNYGNITSNYTWNETEDGFEQFEPGIILDTSFVAGAASFKDTEFNKYNALKNLNNAINSILTNNTDANVTSTCNIDDISTPVQDYGWNNILLLILVIVLVVFIFI